MSYSTLKGSVSRSASGVLGLAQRLVDRVVSPDARQMTYSAVAGFAKERPLLAVCPTSCSPPVPLPLLFYLSILPP